MRNPGVDDGDGGGFKKMEGVRKGVVGFPPIDDRGDTADAGLDPAMVLFCDFAGKILVLGSASK